MTKNIVIVGAGLTGLSIAKILNKEKNICLIEASNNLGGILSSIKFDKDYFDFGTHFLRETGVKTLDRILFKELKKKWANYLILKSGSIYNNKTEYNQFVNLKDTKFSKSLIDNLINNKIRGKIKIKNEKDRCLNDYGKLITDKIIEPKIQKITSRLLKDLPINFSKKFNFGRFNLDDDLLSKNLKKNKNLDKILSFKYNHQGISGLKNYYPKTGGINKFKDFFIGRKLKIYFNEKVQKVEIKNKNILNLTTNKRSLKVDKLYWTADRNIFYNLAFKKKYNYKQDSIFWNFVNIKSNNPFKSKCFYLNIFNSSTNAIRLTIYKNFQKRVSNNMTLEFVSKHKKKTRLSTVENLLLKYNIINKNDKIKIINQIPLKLNYYLDHKKFNKFNNFRNFFFSNNNYFEQKNQEENLINIYNSLKE